jgi:hypothetical protein
LLNRFTGSAERKAGLVADIPLKRAGTPAEIADAIVFVASRKASFITGPDHRRERRQNRFVIPYSDEGPSPSLEITALGRRIARLRPEMGRARDNPANAGTDPRDFAELTRTTDMIKEAPASVRCTVADRTQPPVGGRFVLGRRASLLVSAGVVSHTLWTSAAPALTYGLYAQECHLTHAVTAGIFAIYPIGVVVILIGFGGISYQIGRRATMLAGLIASLAGALLFAVAPDVWWVFAGRALMGIGVGLAASPSTAAILEFSSQERVKSAASATMGRRQSASPPLC